MRKPLYKYDHYEVVKELVDEYKNKINKPINLDIPLQLEYIKQMEDLNTKLWIGDNYNSEEAYKDIARFILEAYE